MDYGRCRILTDWPDWDYEIHNDKAQIKRQGKAMNYPFYFEIDKKNKTAQFSSTSELPYYDTSLTSCNCWDFETRHLPCKHIYRLAVELGIIEIINRKPGGYNEDVLAEIYASEDMDNHPEQLKRIKSAQSAKTTPSSIDREKRTGIFPGSGKKPYETTLQSCTCRDFFVRGLPCKHIYRLKIELGLLDIKRLAKELPNNNPEFAFDEVTTELEKLTEKNQQTIQIFLYKVLYHKEPYLPIIINNETAELLTCPLLRTETQDLPEYALRIFGRNQLIDILDEHGISGFKRNSSQKNLILWCIENVPDIWAVFPKVTLLCFSDSFQKARRKTYSYLLRKYDWDSYYNQK